MIKCVVFNNIASNLHCINAMVNINEFIILIFIEYLTNY